MDLSDPLPERASPAGNPSPLAAHDSPPYAGPWTLLLGIVITLGIVSFLFWNQRISSTPLPVLSAVGSFTLTNQDSRLFTSTQLEGKAWIGNIIFTRCPGPCARMTKLMSEIARDVPNTDLHFVTLTADPAYDHPDVLKKFGQKYNADFSRWDFLTGTKSNIVHVASDQLLLTAVDKDPAARESPEDLFIHSTISVVVDRRGRLRAAIEVLETNGPAMLREAVRRVLKE